ncbi:hypothetical protein PUN28_006261 [Cardiocondyla obscurior]|uniref:Uncharacterized protein n=1 Tax=Cardiocondyla obscurior TaxID=286306 RepID=A0AAW2GAN9_9HYME
MYVPSLRNLNYRELLEDFLRFLGTPCSLFLHPFTEDMARHKKRTRMEMADSRTQVNKCASTHRYSRLDCTEIFLAPTFSLSLSLSLEVQSFKLNVQILNFFSCPIFFFLFVVITQNTFDRY